MIVSSRSPKVLWRMVGLKGTLQVERGNKDGKHGYTVILYTASRSMYSWWWDSHISPKNSKWLQENLTDRDEIIQDFNLRSCT
ncbi:hypothetical protein ACS0TY_010957 [Phlomoides rotata]